MTTTTHHPSGVRVVRRERVHELGPADNEGTLFALLGKQVDEQRVTDVDSVVVDWRDDGCYLAVHTSTHVILRGLRSA